MSSKSSKPKILHYSHTGRGFVERIEMYARRALLEQIGALLRGVFNAELGGRGIVRAQRIKASGELGGNFCAAHGSELLDLRGAQDGNDARHERHLDSQLAREIVTEFVEIRVVKEKLREDIIRAGGHLIGEIMPVMNLARLARDV